MKIVVMGGSGNESLINITIEGSAGYDVLLSRLIADAKSLTEVMRTKVPSGTTDRVMRDLLQAYYDEHQPRYSPLTRQAFETVLLKLNNTVSDSPNPLKAGK